MLSPITPMATKCLPKSIMKVLNSFVGSVRLNVLFWHPPIPPLSSLSGKEKNLWWSVRVFLFDLGKIFWSIKYNNYFSFVCDQVTRTWTIKIVTWIRVTIGHLKRRGSEEVKGHHRYPETQMRNLFALWSEKTPVPSSRYLRTVGNYKIESILSS